MCNCIEETTKELREHVKENANKKYTIHSWEDEGTFENSAYMFKAGETKLYSPFVVQFRKQKKNGEPEKNLTTNRSNIFFNFCPFCGEKQESK